jgi:hypothetical protein
MRNSLPKVADFKKTAARPEVEAGAGAPNAGGMFEPHFSRRRRIVATALTLVVWALFSAGVRADTLSLTLKLWTVKGEPKITCTGKAWVELGPGMLDRTAIITLLATPNHPAQDEKLLACDDGSGHDAPITGAVSQVRFAHPGQSVLQGPMRVIVLQPHVKKGMASAVILAVRKDAGDLALMAKNGQGVLRLDHKTGIDIYPASYAVVKVIETTVYQIDEGPPPLLQPCSVFYFRNDPTSRPKVVRSNLDCVSLIERANSSALFAGKVPGKI